MRPVSLILQLCFTISLKFYLLPSFAFIAAHMLRKNLCTQHRSEEKYLRKCSFLSVTFIDLEYQEKTQMVFLSTVEIPTSVLHILISKGT